MRPPTALEIQAALQLLGIEAALQAMMGGAKGPEHAFKLLETFKSKVAGAAYRKLAAEVHPDRADGGNEDRMKDLSAAYNIVKGLQLRVQQPIPQPTHQIIIIRRGGAGFYEGTGSTSTTSSTWFEFGMDGWMRTDV